MDEVFGIRLKKLRENKKMLQKEVAHDLNITVQRYSSYENNLRVPEADILIKIAKYYNVSLDYLVGIEDRTYLNKPGVLEKIEGIKKEINQLEEYIINFK
jgi:transcriptional regulator with XRE-family HTH domain